MVIGAGPVGLAAAAVREWDHIRPSSPWSELIDRQAGKILARTSWTEPNPDRHPTGGAWTTDYLEPLADEPGDRVLYNFGVTGVAKRGRDLIVDSGRDEEAFTIHASTPQGEQRIHARAVIDASGTRAGANPLGAEGLPAVGERSAAERINYRAPDITDTTVRARRAGKHIANA